LKKIRPVFYQLLLATSLLFLFCTKTIAQPCACTNCPKNIPDLDTVHFPIKINGATNNNLASPLQGVCKVCVKFKHDFVSDLQMTLVAPSGQSIVLVAPISQTGYTANSVWDVCFVPCAQTALPDKGLPPQWQNANWVNFKLYSGSYYPYSGCLEDFNAGAVNGTWKLIVEDGDPNYVGEVLNWSITFCDPSGLDCLECVADGGDYSKIPAKTACKGDNSLIFNPIPIYTLAKPAPPATLYSYTNVITKNGIIVGYQNPVNLSNFSAGDYQVCGFSYLTADASKLPIPNGVVTLTDLQNLTVGAKPFLCGKFSKGCVPVNIKPTPDPILIDTTVCSTFKYSTITYIQSGFYEEKLTAKNGCDSIVYLDLKIIAPITKDNFKTICKGNFYTIGANKYNVTGIYKDTLQAISTGCDSIVTTFLTVKSPPSESLSKKICKGDFVKIGTKNYYNSGIYRDTIQNSFGCDSVVILTLTVDDNAQKNIDTTVCFGSKINFFGKIYDKTGVFKDTLKGQNINGCDIFYTIKINVLGKKIDTIKLDICQGDTLRIGTKKYFQTGNYVDQLKSKKHSCDSLIYTFLTVSNVIKRNIIAHICEGKTYNFDGIKRSQSGIYNATNKSKNGCDSLTTLNLTVHKNVTQTLKKTLCYGDTLTLANGVKYFLGGTYIVNLKTIYGCDSVVNLELKVLQKYVTPIVETICEGDSLKIGNKFYKKAGYFVDTIKTKTTNCDSILQVTINIFPKYETIIDTAFCEKKSIKIGNQIFDKAGKYDILLKSKNGCDSLIRLTITLYPILKTTINKAICANQFVEIGNKKYSLSGIYNDTLMSKNGCDSFITLQLKVSDKIEITLNKTICFGDTLKVGNSFYFQTGKYIDSLKAQGDCDSIVTSNLTVINPDVVLLNENRCEGDCVKIGDSTFCKKGFFKIILKNRFGCDSTILLDLKLKTRPIVEFKQKICEGDSIKIGPNFYFETNIYNDTLTAANGCDSIVIVDLFVTPILKTNINKTLCFGDTTKIGDVNYWLSGDYTQNLKSKKTGCDSIVSIKITVLPEKITSINKTICNGQQFLGYTQTGDYDIVLKALSSNCDSLIRLKLTVQDSSVIQRKDTICYGEKLTIGNTTISKSGFYKISLKTTFGCDSILYVNAFVPSCDFKISKLTTNVSCDNQAKGSLKILLSPDFQGVMNISAFQNGNLLLVKDIAAQEIFTLDNLDAGKIIIALKNFKNEIQYDTVVIEKQTLDINVIKIAKQNNGFSLKCYGDDNGFIQTGVSGGVAPYRFVWQGIAAKTASIYNLKAGKYSLTVTDTLGCKAVLDTALTAPPKPEIIFSVKNPICNDSKDGVVTIDTVTGDKKPYIYFVDNQQFNNGKSFKNLSGGSYLIKVQGTDGCVFDTTAILVSPPPIQVDLGKDTTLLYGEAIFLEGKVNIDASEIQKIRWNDFVQPTCPTCLTALVKPSFSTGYLLEITDKKGCKNFAVKAVFVNDTLPIFIPTAFSPNDDGVNDIFKIFSNDKIQIIKQLSIYNRWGDKVYQGENLATNDTQQGWDGMFKDTPQPSGVYIYHAVVELGDKKQKVLKGEVNLVR
jgi:gliding motility-associated-like protein